MTSSRKALYWVHIGILLFGSLAGIIAAYYFNSIEFDFSADIEEAKRLGIVSLTVLNGYSKSRDILTYLSVLGFPVIFSVGIWFLWANKERRSYLRELFPDSQVNGNNKMLSLFLIVILFLFTSFNISFFYVPYHNDYTGSWPFLGEEGSFLAWAHSILSGGVYGKDFICLYGPMLIYPLAWAMKLFGTTIAVERFYTYFLNLIAYGIVIFFLFKTLRFTFVLSVLIYLALFPGVEQLSPHNTDLRVILGILPILLAYLYLGNGKKLLLPAIGVIVGQSLLFGQEVGVCSVFSIIFFFVLSYPLRPNYKGIIWEMILIFAGCLASLAPMLLYLYFKSALSPALVSLYGFPRYYSLGYGSLPFPIFRDFMANPLSEGVLLFYWPIFIYIFSSIYLIPLIFLRSMNRDHLLKASLLVFGIFLFRYALGRSDVGHAIDSLPPAILLVLLFIDGAVRDVVKGTGFNRVGGILLLSGLLLSICSLFAYTNFNSNLPYLKRMIMNPEKKWSLRKTGVEIPELQKGGIFFESQTALSIIKIKEFLDVNTGRGDYVYFFPNEAAYYFLFDRTNPTRYAISYVAATREQREEIVMDLEKNRPEYLIYSKNTWRIDNISETIQVPEVVEYLNKKYKPVMDLEDVLIAKRISGWNLAF